MTDELANELRHDGAMDERQPLVPAWIEDALEWLSNARTALDDPGGLPPVQAPSQTQWWPSTDAARYGVQAGAACYAVEQIDAVMAALRARTAEVTVGEPGESVYLVARDSESPIDTLMVFSDELEADRYAEWCGGEVLAPEPVFRTSADCRHWCHGEDSEDVES